MKDTAMLQQELGYTFREQKLLETALTHSSYSREQGAGCECNERLEFLGDAFFDAIIGSVPPSSARNLWRRPPGGWTWAVF